MESEASPISDVLHFLRQRLQHPLPGRVAQQAYEPAQGFGRHYHSPPSDARQAAVAILLYPRAGVWHLPLLVRPTTMLEHGGQIALPGGKVEAGESSREAALRELHEELGVGPDQIDVLGMLSPINLFVSNYAIQPWLISLPAAPIFDPAPYEVAQVLEMPISVLTSPDSLGRYEYHRFGVSFTSPCIQFDGFPIWGATALILGELAGVLGEASTALSDKPTAVRETDGQSRRTIDS